MILIKYFKDKTIFQLLIYFLFLISFIVIILSSIVNIFEKREKIIFFLSSASKSNSPSYGLTDENIYWAKEILKGGYILHFRHAERDKWIDVQMYDALESDVHENGIDESRYAEESYFSNAVCLNERGKVQARAMGEHINFISLPIGHIFSSVSCRARQTANLAFGGYDSLHRILVHPGPYNENKKKRISNLIDFYRSLPIDLNRNTIVSAHNSVINCEMFLNECKEDLFLEEGGFYVISKKENGLYLEHEFNNFNNFTQVFYER